MRIDELTLTAFRNYQQQRVTFDPGCNVIFGENAQGKTNLLEALVFLSRGRSPRARSDREMIAFDAPAGRIDARLLSREREFHVEVDLYREKRRRITINGVAAKSAAALGGVLHTVLFQPEDLFLIREGAAARRRFADTALCQLRPRYDAALTAYNRALDQKTRILRDSEDYPRLLDTLPEFNEQLVQYGAVLIGYRARFVKTLSAYAARCHAECSGGREELAIAYRTVSAVEDPEAPREEIAAALRRHMASHAAAEAAARQCLSGPHKDDLFVTIDGREARAYSSQGQTRTAALAMKLAEREIYQNDSGEYPVLLLDDVLSELDPRRQEFVLNRIPGGQVFITCCEDDRLPGLLGGKVLRVSGGRITE